MQAPSTHLDVQRFSVLAAVILLGNGLSRLVTIPAQAFVVTILGIEWLVGINSATIFLLLLGALIASGAESIYRSHPSLEGEPFRLSATALHWILPALTTVGGGAALSLLPAGPRWWLGLAVATAVIVFSVAGEYIVLDRSDARFDVASLGLEVLAFTLLALVISALHASETRLAFSMPAIAVSTSFLALRVLTLRAPLTRRTWAYTAGIGLVVGELALPLNFWPLPSVAYGLGLTVSAYVVSGLARRRLLGEMNVQALVEYAVVAGIALLALLALTRR